MFVTFDSGEQFSVVDVIQFQVTVVVTFDETALELNRLKRIKQYHSPNQRLGRGNYNEKVMFAVPNP